MALPLLRNKQSVLLIANECSASGTAAEVQNFRWVRTISDQKPVILLLPSALRQASLSRCLPDVKIVYLGTESCSGDPQSFTQSARGWIREQMLLGQEFTVAHHLTEDICGQPSPLIGLGIPYVLGPVSRFSNKQSLIRDKVKDDLEQLHNSPLILSSLQQAGAILAADKQTNRLLEHCGLSSVEVLSPTLVAMPQHAYPSLAGRAIRILHVGSIEDPKSSRALLKAFVALKDLDDVSLYSLQEPKRNDDSEDGAFMQSLINRLESTDLLVLSDDQVSRFTIEAALKLGVPVITVNRNDGSQLVDHSCGFVLDNSDTDDLALRIAETIRRIYQRPFLLTPLRGGARERARELHFWRESGEQVVDLYDRLITEISQSAAVAN